MIGLLAPPASAGLLARVRGILLVILLIVAILGIGFGLVELVSLPFGGISLDLAIFYGIALVVVALGVMAYIGRRRQRAARAKRAEETAARAEPLRPLGVFAGPERMCGRYSLAGGDLKQLRARFPIGEGVEVRRRFNVAPTDEVLAVTTTRDGTPRGEELRWGLVPAWSKDSRGAHS